MQSTNEMKDRLDRGPKRSVKEILEAAQLQMKILKKFQHTFQHEEFPKRETLIMRITKRLKLAEESLQSRNVGHQCKGNSRNLSKRA